MTKTVFISADHGMAIIYFLQSDVVTNMLAAGVRVVLLTDDEIVERINATFGREGLVIEGLKISQANHYAQKHHPRIQWLLAYLRRVGSSWRINTQAQDSHIFEVWKENGFKFKLGVLIPAAVAILALRASAQARKLLVKLQTKFDPGIYQDIFDKYQPSLVIASTAGWRLDRYLLREANRLGIETMACIVGWDNPSSYAIPGAPIDWATCWSQQQKRELVDGADWRPDKVNIGGIPSYDGYVRNLWKMQRDVYFALHGLDTKKKLIAYACSFVHFAPNYPNILAIAELIGRGSIEQDAQLLIRLHPSHFQNKPAIFAKEREQIFELESTYPFIHVVRPKALGGSLGYYGGEDMDEKSSMMAHADVFVTVYSTMVVETAVHDTPIIAAVIDTPGGWNMPGKFSLPLKEIGDWPTHQRFRDAKAGKVAENSEQLGAAINLYLNDRTIDGAERRAFIEKEITYVDGTSGQRTADFILRVLNRS